ncbi:MAG: hypothetical protein ACKN83_11245 [Vulcanococcus sp.]
MQLAHTMGLAGCAAGLRCSLITGTVRPEPAQAQQLLAQAATQKASPFAAAKVETNAPDAAAAGQDTLQTLTGSKAAGTKTNSPFAAAKESDATHNTDPRADRSRLWWLLVPVGVAAISYGALRSQDGDSSA